MHSDLWGPTLSQPRRRSSAVVAQTLSGDRKSMHAGLGCRSRRERWQQGSLPASTLAREPGADPLPGCGHIWFISASRWGGGRVWLRLPCSGMQPRSRPNGPGLSPDPREGPQDVHPSDCKPLRARPSQAPPVASLPSTLLACRLLGFVVRGLALQRQQGRGLCSLPFFPLPQRVPSALPRVSCDPSVESTSAIQGQKGLRLITSPSWP